MTDQATALDGSRKVSRGIGGAGNMRRPSDNKAAEDAMASGSIDEIASERRRSSVWSNSSSTGTRRASIMSLFRRGSSKEENSVAVDDKEESK